MTKKGLFALTLLFFQVTVTAADTGKLQLDCQLEYENPQRISISIDFDAKTARGYPAQVSEDTIFWFDGTFKNSLNRYTGILNVTDNEFAMTWRCAKATQRQF